VDANLATDREPTIAEQHAEQVRMQWKADAVVDGRSDKRDEVAPAALVVEPLGNDLVQGEYAMWALVGAASAHRPVLEPMRLRLDRPKVIPIAARFGAIGETHAGDWPLALRIDPEYLGGVTVSADDEVARAEVADRAPSGRGEHGLVDWLRLARAGRQDHELAGHAQQLGLVDRRQRLFLVWP
jgi:hypothetical protein